MRLRSSWTTPKVRFAPFPEARDKGFSCPKSGRADYPQRARLGHRVARQTCCPQSGLLDQPLRAQCGLGAERRAARAHPSWNVRALPQPGDRRWRDRRLVARDTTSGAAQYAPTRSQGRGPRGRAAAVGFANRQAPHARRFQRPALFAHGACAGRLIDSDSPLPMRTRRQGLGIPCTAFTTT